MALVSRKTAPWLVSISFALCAGIMQWAAGNEYSTNENFLDNLLFDFTLAQNSLGTSYKESGEEYEVVVIALDDKSYRDEGLKEQGVRALAPALAILIEALAAGKAKAIGLDFVFSYPASYLEAGGEDTLRLQVRNNRDILVLGRTEKVDTHKRFQGLLGDERRIASIDVRPDSDNVFRRVPSRIEIRGDAADESFVTTLSGALLQRVNSVSEIPDSILIAPKQRLEDLPAYSFIDVVKCYQNGDLASIGEIVRGKIIVVGSTMTGEDRKITSDRFMRRLEWPVGQAHSSQQRCSLMPVDVSAPGARTVPGVYLHAAAIDTVIRNQITKVSPRHHQIFLAIVAVFAAAWVGFRAAPWLGLVMVVSAILVFHIFTSVLLANLYWVPMAWIAVCMLIAILVSYAFRYVFVDAQKRKTQAYFTSFLHPNLVQEYAETGREPEPEEKEITIMFADLSGFTRMSEEIDSESLVRLTNEYLQVITEEVINSSGYVDKLIGDAVMAIWGAPVSDNNHADHAVDAALRIAKKVKKKQIKATREGKHGFGIKIGINTGSAVVGNIGGGGKLNYTAVGSSVNTAARLESVPQIYNCTVVVSQDTFERVRANFILNEIDWITVRGKKAPFSIYQPLCRKDEEGKEERLYCSRYAKALKFYRQHNFVKASEMWSALYSDLLSQIANKRFEFGPAKVMSDKASNT